MRMWHKDLICALPREKFEERVRRDKEKFDYCQNHNIKLYYITYKDNIEEKLKEILDGLYSK